MSGRKSKEDTVANIPSRPAPTPSAQVPSPKPAPAVQTAPHISAGTANDVKIYGQGVDPFTGKTVLPADL